MSVIPGLLLTKEGAQGRAFVHPLLLVHLGPLFLTYCPQPMHFSDLPCGLGQAEGKRK